MIQSPRPRFPVAWRGRVLASTIALSGFLMLVNPPSALAQSAQDRLNGMISDLNALIDSGAQRNLADPWYLDELRTLSRRYSETWPRVLMEHQFDSQSGTPKPPWRVRAGQMQVDWSRGLRSRVEVAAPQQTGQSQQRTQEEVVGALVGTLLGQALGTQQPQPQQATPAADPTQPALAVADVAVSNAFRIEAEISGRDMAGAEKGGLELGVFQPGDAGYRLVITPNAGGKGARLDLLVVSSRGTSQVVDSVPLSVAVLSDQPFTLIWSRYPNGRTTVAVNGTDFIAADDRTFADPFSGILLVNRGGDWAVKWMTVKGT